MIHEKIINDNRGKVVIRVTLVTFGYYGHDLDGNKFRYDVQVFHTPKGKRKEVINLPIATDNEIWEAKHELWDLIEPK